MKGTKFSLMNNAPQTYLTVPNGSYWLSRFLVETRQKNGNKYPAKTLYQLLCGINRYIRSRAPNLIDNKEPEFKELHHTMDSYFRTLKIGGVGATVKHAAIISKDEAVGKRYYRCSYPKFLLSSIIMAKCFAFVVATSIGF